MKTLGQLIICTDAQPPNCNSMRPDKVMKRFHLLQWLFYFWHQSDHIFLLSDIHHLFSADGHAHTYTSIEASEGTQSLVSHPRILRLSGDHITQFSIGGRPALPFKPQLLHSKGHERVMVPGFSNLHVQVSLSEILNPELFIIYENVCASVSESFSTGPY